MIVFFDIETVRDDTLTPNENDLERYSDRINFMPEFNKIFCISVWYIADDGYQIKTFSWYETEIVNQFFDVAKAHDLSGFNIKWFDIPFVVKRAVKLGIPVPQKLKVFGKKPWEVGGIIDICEAWKHIWYNTASLDVTCRHLGIKSSKDGIDGSQVQDFVDQWKWDEVIRYCEEDVRATMDIYKKLTELNFM